MESEYVCFDKSSRAQQIFKHKCVKYACSTVLVWNIAGFNFFQLNSTLFSILYSVAKLFWGLTWLQGIITTAGQILNV